MANRGFRIGFPVGYQLLAAFGQYNLTGQAVILTITGGAGAFISWTAVPDATGYQVGWATLPSWPAYPNIVDVGNVLSIASSALPGIGTGTRQLAVCAYYDPLPVPNPPLLYDEWSAEVTKIL